MGVKIKERGEITLFNRAIPVQIGDVCCSVICHDKRIARHLKQLYTGFLSDKPTDISIELDIVERFSTQHIESTSSQAKILKWEEYIAAICHVNGDEPSLKCPAVKVTVERQQFDPRLGFKIMNLLMPISYYTKHHRNYRGSLCAMFVHACGILRRGRLIIFTGPSETGKTTIARLCGNEHGKVVNDEMLLVTGGEQDGGNLMVQGAPIIGGVAQRLNVKAPLTCVMMLKQAKKTSIRPLGRLEAYLRFMRQVIAPRDLIEPDDINVMLSEISGFSDGITKAVPFYELEFNLESEPIWRAVGEIEESFMKGEPLYEEHGGEK